MTQSNNSKIQTRPIEDLLQVMTRMVTIQEEIIEALKVAQQASTVSIEMDGGDFSKDK